MWMVFTSDGLKDGPETCADWRIVEQQMMGM